MYGVSSRTPFANQCRRIQVESIERLRAKYGNAADSIAEEFQEKNLNEFVRSKFTAAALGVLAIHGEPGDIKMGRRYLAESDHKLQLEALRIVERFGDVSDLPILLEIAKTSYGEAKELAARVALKLAPGLSGAAHDLGQTEDPILVGLVIRSLWDASDKDGIRQFLEPLLGSEKEVTRTKSLAYFMTKLSKDELDQLLFRYMERPTYYYNVVCWLDRVLYAPFVLREMFVRQLEAKLD